MRGTAAMAGCALVIASVAGCGSRGASELSTPMTSGDQALAACAKMFGSDVGSAGPTTIGDIRESGGGPALTPPSSGVAEMPAVHAFGDEPNSAPGAWCWVSSPGEWTLFGIDMRGTRVAMYTVTGVTDSTPPTPPAGIAAWL